jgi:hypothetical protein
MRGQDVVFASLRGAMAQRARAFIEAMHAEGVKRLIFDPDYTILRPGWFTHDEAIPKLATSPVLYVRCSVGVSGTRTR